MAHRRAAEWAGINSAEALRHWGKVRDLLDATPQQRETLSHGAAARWVFSSRRWPLPASTGLFSKWNLNSSPPLPAFFWKADSVNRHAQGRRRPFDWQISTAPSSSKLEPI